MTTTETLTGITTREITFRTHTGSVALPAGTYVDIVPDEIDAWGMVYAAVTATTGAVIPVGFVTCP